MSNLETFDTKRYSDKELFDIAESSKQYEELREHINNVLDIYFDYIMSKTSMDISRMMRLENNAGWEKDETHSLKIDLLFELQKKYLPKTDRFLS